PGTYTFSTPASPGIVHPHLPEMFYLWANNLTLAESTILNIRLPNISLAVTVLDLANNPVPGTTVRTELAMTYTTFSAESVWFHGNFDPYGITDSAGRALVWMFPTTTNIKIAPPAASGFAAIMVDSVTIVSDKSMVVHLESLLDVRPGRPVPAQFTLLQNYPNPFNPTTTIEYALPVSGFVTLTVVDIMGREAAVLVNENKEGGRWYAVTCDMHNFSAGVYFYHLRVGEFRETRKFVLLK
ncbi:MAG: T9SS type A sorting domain-containing protein, partial [Bacteroidota bacterium]